MVGQGKQEFKAIAIRRTKIRRKLQGHERFKLERERDRLQEQAVNGTTSDIERYLSAKEKLRQLELVDLEAIKVRTKARFIEEGEKSTRYLFSLEKSRRADQTRPFEFLQRRAWILYLIQRDYCQSPMMRFIKSSIPRK